MAMSGAPLPEMSGAVLARAAQVSRTALVREVVAGVECDEGHEDYGLNSCLRLSGKGLMPKTLKLLPAPRRRTL